MDNVQELVKLELMHLFPEMEFGVEDTVKEMLTTLSFEEVTDLVIALANYKLTGGKDERIQ